MRLNQSERAGRGGFTMVELLMVILIIALLAAISTGAVMRVIIKGPEVQARSEIAEFGTGLSACMTDMNVKYLPSRLVIREDGNYSAHPGSYAFLQQAFGKRLNLGSPIDWNGDGTISNTDLVLQGHHCLVFFLGGYTGTQGWAKGPNPIPGATTTSRMGPYFNFQTNRLVQDPTNKFFYYVDAYSKQPYAYFSSYGKLNTYVATDCSNLSVQPYYHTRGTLNEYENPRSYQIICAGRDGVFGNTGVWTPSGGLGPNQPGSDDQSNFAPNLLGDGQ